MNNLKVNSIRWYWNAIYSCLLDILKTNSPSKKTFIAFNLHLAINCRSISKIIENISLLLLR